jgi:hypothetical protein
VHRTDQNAEIILMPKPDRFHWARRVSRAKVQAIAAEMGIPGRSKMREDELVKEILRRRQECISNPTSYTE